MQTNKLNVNTITSSTTTTTTTMAVRLLVLFAFLQIISATELTFELPDSAKECFHESVNKNTSVTLEFQVVTGGQYDVDVALQDPKNNVIYQQYKSQFDSYTFVANITGIYMVCFSNEFSTFSHKLVYMDFQVGEEQPLPGIGEHITALTQMETSSQDIHKALNTIIDMQTHHRLREMHGRKRAEDLNSKVFFWAVLETAAILSSAIGQVIILKMFFRDNKSVSPY